MGAEVPIWVEIEVAELRWVKVDAVTSEEAIEQASMDTLSRPTGNISYQDPESEIIEEEIARMMRGDIGVT